MASHNTSFVDNKIKWNTNTEYALGNHKKVIRFLGYWAKDKFDNSLKTRVAIMNIVHISCAIVFIKNFIVYGNCGSSEELVDALTLMSGSFLAILKNTLPWFQKNLYNDILDFLIDDWSDINNNNNKSRKIMFKYAKISRIVLFIQLLGAYGSLISLIAHYPSTNQIMNEYNNDSIFVRNIPYGPRCWISLTMPWNLYVGFYIILCVDLFFLTTSFIGSDVFLFTIAIHVCGQFEILYNSMEAVIYNSNWDDLSPKIIKDMTFIIARSQYEFNLTAGKMQNMNLSNFKDIVKSIFSYLSILRLMFEK
ncbi:uncharacterized protein LOC122858575 [Aphidius gifuensis]|uniref:uncharacterized protein LOC122858575 n=1 Tax=Aphidius gifuensis TaxID=684658 RepID=UPI001CDD89CE|nr:uncharacterized protein LOC122858575 [Aphidius gifuensis]